VRGAELVVVTGAPWSGSDAVAERVAQAHDMPCEAAPAATDSALLDALRERLGRGEQLVLHATLATTGELQALRDALAPARLRLRLICVSPPLATIIARAPEDGEGAHLDEVMRRSLGGTGLWLEDDDPDSAARSALARWDEACVV
jgi:hypothetical protein